MKTIYKYTLNLHVPSIMMPDRAKILSVHEQRDEICIWAEIDTDAVVGFRKFVIYGTGHEIHEPDFGKQKYIGSVHLMKGKLVLHIYELI